MKKILFCIFLLFILGCIPAEQFKGIEPIEEIEEGAEKIVEEGLNFVEKLIPSEYRFVPGSSLTILGKKVTVEDITSEYNVIVKVNNERRVIETTQTSEYINGLNVIVLELNFDATGVNTYTILKITEFKLEENEYLLYYKDKITVNGKKIELDDVLTDNLESIAISVDGVYAKLNKGETETLSGLKITNIETNPRASSSEKYAIIKIEIL